MQCSFKRISCEYESFFFIFFARNDMFSLRNSVMDGIESRLLTLRNVNAYVIRDVCRQ